MMFYTTVAGWMLHYFYLTAAGKFAGQNAEQIAGGFGEMLARSKGDDVLDGVRGRPVHFRLCQRSAERSGKGHQSDDDRAACHHGSAGCQQL